MTFPTSNTASRACAASLLAIACLLAGPAHAQVDEDQLGAWYMAFWGASIGDNGWGVQGDFQNRNWDTGGDLEQWLLRSGVTYRPEGSNTLYTFGYANIRTGAFGDSDASFREDRVYQEALISQKPASWLSLRHRFRFEQRWVDGQDCRTRVRYALFADIPINGRTGGKGAVYLALYNELFLNSSRDIGDGRRVDIYDRNRTYAALGYGLSDRYKTQFGYMYQHSEGVEKGQLQLSLHASF